MRDSSNYGPHRLLNRFRMHPTNADLVAYRDGELPSENHARIKEHLQHCERCRIEAGAIEEGLLLFNHLAGEVGVPPEFEAGLLALQKAMDDRSAEGPARARSSMELPVSQAMLASISKELTIYLGARAAQKLLARMTTTTFSVEDLIGNIGPLMAGLLGDRGGSAVAGRIAMLCGTTPTRASGSVAQ
jgi:predicted anti-sigma-YlaC factor YlaD